MGMFTALLEAFRTPDLRNKILFTLGMLVVFRFLAHVPLPGVDQAQLQNVLSGSQLLNLLDLFSGGGLARLSVVALGVNPYINASIIMTLLNQTIPALEQLSKEGEYGRNRINQYTRILTVPLALLQGIGVAVFMQRSGVLPAFGPDNLGLTLAILSSLTAGTLILMWLGELISERGIGNGISFIIFAGIVGRLPTTVAQTLEVQTNLFALVAIAIVAVLVIGAIIFIQEGQRRVPVQYAKRMIGRRQYGGTSTYIPLKVNQAGVIPVIFAASLMYLPALISQFQQDQTKGWVVFINTYLTRGDHPIYWASYFAMIVFFTYFYVAITFDPTEVADNMKKYGGFVPGIRAGRPTAQYLEYILSRITLAGSLYLGLLCLFPMIAFGAIGASGNFPLGGVNILIIVGVGLETVKQIEAQLQQRHYEGFLR
jgi:preprotein translocase subunit SecY